MIADSGHRGAYGLIDPETGVTTETGTLPLGTGATDDLEGVAVRGGKIHAITSAGWIRTYRRSGAGFALEDGPYAMGAIDLPPRGGAGDTPPAGNGVVCDGAVVNCGRNYEGLCLIDGPAAPCIGFAASKADGHLYCVVEHAGRLGVSFSPRIPIARAGVIADCAFAEDRSLWVGSNLFDAARVYEVVGWTDPSRARVRELASIGLGFPETLAVRGDTFYRASDAGGSPSLLARFRCRR